MDTVVESCVLEKEQRNPEKKTEAAQRKLLHDVNQAECSSFLQRCEKLGPDRKRKGIKWTVLSN